MSLASILTPAQRQSLTWTAVALVFLLILFQLAPILTPFVAAIGLAYMLEPLVEAMERALLPRLLAVVFALLLMVLLTLSIVLIVIPVLQQELLALRQQIPVLLEAVNTHVLPRLSSVAGQPIEIDLSYVRTFLTEQVSGSSEALARTALAWLRTGSGVALSIATLLLMVPVLTFYILLDWILIAERVKELVPPRWRPQVFSLARDVDHLLGQCLRGQVMVMLSLAALYCTGLWLAGFQLWLPIGVLSGLLVFIPYVGFAISLVLAALAAFTQFGLIPGLARVAVIYGAGQAMESFVLTPRLVGGRIGLHPLAVFFALVAFGSLLGFVGVLIALPLAAAFSVGLGRIRTAWLASSFYSDPDPRVRDALPPAERAPAIGTAP